MSSAPRVLVAHDSEAIRAVIVALVAGAGYAATAVADGVAARRALAESNFHALVVDVAVGGVMSFELVEDARKQAHPVRVVLVASIYNRTSYKRRPTSLYGADDYVEQHHLADALVDKLRRLVPLDALRGAIDEAAVGEQIRKSALEEEGASTDVESVQRARRLARLIVSDIALYNGDAVAAARSEGAAAIERLEARLRGDLEEGRLLFDLRVAQAVRLGRDFIGEALAELLQTSVVEEER